MFQLWQQNIFFWWELRFLTVFYNIFVLFQHLSRKVSCDSVAKGIDALQMSMLIKFFFDKFTLLWCVEQVYIHTETKEYKKYLNYIAIHIDIQIL